LEKCPGETVSPGHLSLPYSPIIRVPAPAEVAAEAAAVAVADRHPSPGSPNHPGRSASPEVAAEAAAAEVAAEAAARRSCKSASIAGYAP